MLPLSAPHLNSAELSKLKKEIGSESKYSESSEFAKEIAKL